MISRRRRAAMAATAAVLSTLGALLVAEVASRILGDQPIRPAVFAADVWVGQHPVSEQRRLAADPVLVSELVPGQRHCVADGCLTVTADGHRRSPSAPAVGDTGAVIVAMVGDSFTFGFGVADEETLPAQLEAVLHARGFDHVRVINLGVSGYDAAQCAKVVETKATGFSPALVVYCYSRNDPELYWQEGNPTLWETVPLLADAPAWQRLLASSRLIEATSRRLARRARAQADAARDDNPYFAFIHRPAWPGMWVVEHSLATMQAASDRAGAELAVVLLPDEMSPDEARLTTGRVAAICDARGVATLDLLPVFLGQPDRPSLWTRLGPPHFNPAGNRLLAEAVAAGLADRFAARLAGAQLPAAELATAAKNSS